MLGVEYQHIYCRVKRCKHNEKHTVYDGNDKVVEIYYTCKKEDINIDSNGRCKSKEVN